MRARTKNCHQLTLPATNIAPENGCLECKFHQVSFWNGRGYVSFREGANFVQAGICGDGGKNREDVGQGVAGSVLCSEGFESTKWRTGTCLDMTSNLIRVNYSYNFNLVQDPTHGTPNLQLARSISLYIWIVIYQSSMTLFKFNDFSNQCPRLAWGPELVSRRRRNEIHQIDPNGTKPKRVKHLGWILFPLFAFWSCSGLSLLKACWNMLESPIGYGCTSRTHRMKGLWCPCFYCLSSAEGGSTATIIFNYQSWTWLITTFLPCHLLPFVHVRCLFLHKKYKDHCQSFCGVADEVCPPGLRPWMDYEKHMAAKHALSSMLFVRVLSRYICASIPRHPPPHPMVMGLYSGAPVSPVSPPPPVVWVVVGGGGGRSCICMYMYVFVYDYMICIWLYVYVCVCMCMCMWICILCICMWICYYVVVRMNSTT